ncbi:MAG: GMC family oxidoreductase, partial [Myxococcota bacterium]|nr:GMC family oxidoreductase [Myxococcota bacterium]
MRRVPLRPGQSVDREERCQFLVVGSGPGGSTSAYMLAEAGHDVLLVEEGANHTNDSAPSYSLDEMDQKYRNGGLTTTFGKTNVTYIEGRCVGGASEINAALYHRPLPSTLQDWQSRYRIADFDYDQLVPFFEETEKELCVSRHPAGVGPTSLKLREGAHRLGWKTAEIARFWKYEELGDGTWKGSRQSMSKTFIPRALGAGCRLLAQTRVHSLEIEGQRAVSALARTMVEGRSQSIRIHFDEVFVCGGAVQTPLLLRRSGLRRNIGDSLRLHPMVRFAARFPEPFNDPTWGVPVEQIEQFKPRLTLGCSHSSLPHLALWLGEEANRREALVDWKNMAVFYVAAVGAGRGKVRNLPLLREPFVTCSLPPEDLALVGEGLYRLGQAVLAAGAEEIHNPINGGPPLRTDDDLRFLRDGVAHGNINVTTIHLFSSCPMGQDREICAVDSYGKLYGYSNIHLNDASILPLSPGVNPQG